MAIMLVAWMITELFLGVVDVFDPVSGVHKCVRFIIIVFIYHYIVHSAIIIMMIINNIIVVVFQNDETRGVVKNI
jgi:hypothetical protein